MRDFVRWYKLKTELEQREFSGNFSEREVWWCSLGANLGDEEDGKNALFERPILVLKKYNKNLLLALPLSSTRKSGQFYCSISSGGFESSALLSQVRAISTKRLHRRLGRLTEREYDAVVLSFAKLHHIKSNPQLLGDSRAPNGDLYTYDSESCVKGQPKEEK